MEHKLKTKTDYFNAHAQGLKNFEIRWDDRNYKVGDILILQDYDEETGLSGREIRKRVTYLTTLEQVPGYIVMAVENDGGIDWRMDAFAKIARMEERGTISPGEVAIIKKFLGPIT
jgi:ASC-1-like (ASCH) protein